MRIDSSGNVGIGTSSVGSETLVVEKSSGTPTIRINAPSGSQAQLKLQADGTVTDTQMIHANTDASLGFSRWDGSAYQERMRIDSSGNVGIGNSTPSNNHANANNLVVGNGTAGGIANYVGTGLGWYAFSRANANNSDAFDGGISYDGSRNLMFHTNAGSERMRLDASGNLLVGKTSANATDVGIVANANGRLYAAASGASSIFNRTSSDGDIVDFRKDGSTVGSIGIQSTGFYIDGESGHAGIRFAGNEVSPRDNGSDADGVVSLGESDKRFKDLYLSSGVYLGGTGSANKLEDYEEGTFDVALDSGHSGSITLNSSYKTGRYIKIGNTVTFTLHVRISAVSAPSGTLGLTGLPFASPNDPDYRFTFGPCVFFSFTGMTDGDYPVAYFSSKQCINTDFVYLLIYRGWDCEFTRHSFC
jgi:hypothetical protein